MSIAEQYKGYSDEQLLTQIKRYESTAETHLQKANREWAYAKNGTEGYHYGVARDFYSKAKESSEKAHELRALLQARQEGPRVHAFTGTSDKGGSLRSKVQFPYNAGTCAAAGAAISGAMELVMGCANGDSAEEIAENMATSAAAGSVSALAGLGAASVIPGVGGVLAGSLLGSVAHEAVKAAAETYVECCQCGCPISGLADSAEMGVMAAHDALDEITGPARDFICDHVFEPISSALDAFSDWLDLL